MIRKFVTAAAALMLLVGGLFADEVKGVFKKFEGGKVTVEVDGKSVDYPVSADAKIKFGEKEYPLVKAMERFKDGSKLTLTVEKGEVTGAKGERKK